MKILESATLDDLAICLALDPPTAGVQVGGGIHVAIPPDWRERIAAGEHVPGCTHARLDADGSLPVSDVVAAKVVVPAEVSKLNAAKVASFVSRVATANTEAEFFAVKAALAEAIP
jgi:hypothetical protein